MLDVRLVAMPYAAVERPSLALGLLKAGLRSRGVTADVRYANLAFAEDLGLKDYFFFSNSVQMFLLGEWTFSGSAFPDFSPDHQAYLSRFQGILPDDGGYLWNVRAKADAFIARFACRVLEGDPRIVGCTSMFQQHCASLGLLRRVKALRPQVVTMLGGANCEASMGAVTHRCCPWVDYVVSGEADQLMPVLCRKVLAMGRDVPADQLPVGVYGPCHRNRGEEPRHAFRAVVPDLDAVPVPDYDDYFQALDASPLAARIKPGLPIETSRGCWWGQNKQCLFCGINGTRMTYRAKSPDRIVDEFAVLHERHGIGKFVATDSMLGKGHFRSVLPRLPKGEKRYRILFETPAALTRAQVRQLADSGVRWIQPGIESLHDEPLALLGKGTRASSNVQLLKWCMQHGVFVSWVLLTGIPGESARWYQDMGTWLPLIFHLHPPLTLLPIHYARFSPLHRHPQRFGLDLRPLWPYRHVYPFSTDQLGAFAYFFQDGGSNSDVTRSDLTGGSAGMMDLVKEWQAGFYEPRPDMVRLEVSDRRPMLSTRRTGNRLLVTDTRACAVRREHELEDLECEVHVACDAAQTPEKLLKRLNSTRSRKLEWTDVVPTVRRLVDQKLVLEIHGEYLSLAVEAPLPKMLRHDDYPGGLVVIPRSTSTEVAMHSILANAGSS